MTQRAQSIAEVVDNGMCVGCGLCESVTEQRVTMQMTSSGSLLPEPVDGFTDAEQAILLAACPGVVAVARTEPDLDEDLVWGRYSDMRYAWAADPDVRFKAATGGVLTALAMFLLESGQVDSVLHVAADPDAPMRSTWVISETAADIRSATGSRYGPAKPLAGLHTVLERGQKFAVVAKPCDAGALHAHAQIDPRVDELCVARLTMVCGGQSSLQKSTDVLDELALAEDELTLFRYRGFGNPGPTRIETSDDRSFELSYNDMWDDEAGWKLEPRCTICPDALGEASDLAASDAWPGGGPTGDDDGFNGIVVRTAVGARLVADAVVAGALVVGDPITPRQFDDLQPHQVRKKIALAARNQALTAAGRPTIETTGLRIRRLGEQLTKAQHQAEVAGTARRIAAGRYDNQNRTSDLQG